MTKEEEIKLIKELDDNLIKVLESKGHDYATEDVLSNFKRISEAAKALDINVQTPLGYALFMVLLKIDRINNLTSSGKTPNNEGIDDSFGDGINYFKLGYCIHKENNN